MVSTKYISSSDCTNFKAGRLKDFVHNWEKLTSDTGVLDTIQHCHIGFINNEPPIQFRYPQNLIKSQTEIKIAQEELDKLEKLNVIEKSEHEQGEYISNIFLRPKKDGSHRLILNLKGLNEFIEYHHFKMDTIQSALNLRRPNCYMASIDLRHAYYSVPFAKEHQKYLKFKFQGNLMAYTYLPNGISFAPRVFTKMMKPVYAQIRSLCYIALGYIDDSYLQADSAEECLNNIKYTSKILTGLGFINT